MGNAESNAVKNVDKRTARRDHSSKFIAAIANFRGVHADEYGNCVLDDAPERREGDATANRAVRVCVRRRPIFAHELRAGEFDVLTCSRTAICVHDGRLHADCRRLFFKHVTFNFDRVFDERTDSTAVYADAVAPLVGAAAEEGVAASVLMYGQTGSGKTYTMTALTALAAADLFARLATAAGDSVSVSYVELGGEGARDMLNGGAGAKLMTDRSGQVQVVPLVEVPVRTPAALLALIRYAQALRATAATGVHDASSRSHALCTLHIVRADGRCGSLALIDLAGSEQRIDTDKHSSARTRESAVINSSLMALKDGVRALAAGEDWNTPAGGRQPLTQLLRPSFTAPGARTLVLATVSPAAKDTEHAVNTLRHASLMDGRNALAADPVYGPAPGAGGGALSAHGGYGGRGHGERAPSSHLTGGALVVEQLGEIDIHGVQAKLRLEAEALRARPAAAPVGGFGYAARDGVGSDAQRADEARREVRAAASAFGKAERGAARALAEADGEAHTALLEERGKGSAGLNRFQAARLRARAQTQADELALKLAEGGGARSPPRRKQLWVEGGGEALIPTDGMIGMFQAYADVAAMDAAHYERACAAAAPPRAVSGRPPQPPGRAGSEGSLGGGIASASGPGAARHGRRASASGAPRPPAAAAAFELDGEGGPHFGRRASSRPGSAAASPQPARRRAERYDSGDDELSAASSTWATAAAAASPADKTLSAKLSAARARREAADDERREALLRRQQAKGGGGSSPSAAGAADSEIARLEGLLAELPEGARHAQARAGLGRQLAAKKAAARRELMRREAAARAAGGDEPEPAAARRATTAGATAPAAGGDGRAGEPSRLAPATGRPPLGRTQAAPPAPKQGVPLARVACAFEAADRDELSVRRGDTVEILADDGDSPWVEVANTKTGALGLVPRQCLDAL
jgi:kinesin family protein 2/24